VFFSILCVMSLWFPPTCLARTTCIETCASHWLRSQQKCHHWTFLDKSWKTMKTLPPSDFWLYHTFLGCGKNLTLAAYFEIMIHAMRPSQGTRMRWGLIPTVSAATAKKWLGLCFAMCQQICQACIIDCFSSWKKYQNHSPTAESTITQIILEHMMF
jgi:hypothetical protein